MNQDISTFIAPSLRTCILLLQMLETLFNDMFQFVEAHGETGPSTSPYAQFKVMEPLKSMLLLLWMDRVQMKAWQVIITFLEIISKNYCIQQEC